jgi:class 3 adenylate cyclase
MTSFEALQRDAAAALKARDLVRLRDVVADLRTLETPAAAGAALYYDGVAHLYAGDPRTAQTLLQQAHEVATQQHLHKLLGGVETALGQVLMMFGRYADAMHHVDAAIAAYAAADDEAASINALRHRGTILRMLDDMEGAFATSIQCLHLAQRHGDRTTEGLCWYDVGTVHMLTGDLPAAFEALYRSLDIHEQQGDLSEAAGTLSQLGSTYVQFQDAERATEMMLRAIEINERIGNRIAVLTATGNLGVFYLNTERLDDAAQWLERTVAEAADLGAEHHRVFFVEALATVYVAQQRVDDAKRILEQEVDAMARFPDIERSSHVTRSKIMLAEGLVDDAYAMLLQDLRDLDNDRQPERKLYLLDALRSIARTKGDIEAYIEHDTAYKTIDTELRGKATSQKVAMQDTRRKIDDMQREHDRQLAVLHAALPRHVADRVARGEVVHDAYDNAAVLFMDIAGYTTQSGTMLPQETTSLLAEIFQRFDDICERHDVTKIKTIGDAYMAVAFPNSEQRVASSEQRVASSEQRMARVALDMIATSFTWPNGQPIQFRIGIHCGPVVAGVMGTQRLQYDVWGDTVNVASRMESTGEPGRIHISEAFAQLLTAESLTLLPRGLVEVKGKGSMHTYWLEGA